jgi:hypothetical protein
MQQPPMGLQGPTPIYSSLHQSMGPQQAAHPGMQSQPPKRLDPDQMPSPVSMRHLILPRAPYSISLCLILP